MRYKSASIGEVPEHWNVAPLRDFIDLITYGFTNPMPDAEDGPWKVTAKDVVGGRIQYSTARRTTAHAFATLLTDKSRPKIGDVLLTKDGSIGRIAVVDRDNICINQSVALLRPNQRILPRYLAFLLRSPFYQARMEGDSDGSTIKHIYITRVDKMEVAVPPVYEQVEHLSLLGTIDDRIDLLRETNATLEAIAQALFKSWFVDFDPVRAKAEGRDPEGVPPEVANLFPSEFEDSELGEIPKGWGYVRVDMLYSGLYDGPHSTPAPSDAGPAFLGIKNFLPTRLDLSEVRHISEEDWPKWTRRVTPQAGDILFTYEATLGFFALVPEGLRCCLGRRTALVRPKSEMGNGPFLLHSFVSKPFQDLLVARRNHGSTVDRIPLTDFPSYPVLWPGERLARSFSDVVAPLWERIHRNQSQMQWLTEIRDTLLPRLMSGKLRIPQLGGLQ